MNIFKRHSKGTAAPEKAENLNNEYSSDEKITAPEKAVYKIPECEDVKPPVNTTTQPWWLDEEEFFDCVEDAFNNIPQNFSRNLDNVVVQVLPEPLPEHKARLLPGYELLGLYVGVPAPKRGSGYGSFNLPDNIYIFSNPIQRVVKTKDQAVDQIRRTLWHEIGHYYGMNDAELAAIGY